MGIGEIILYIYLSGFAGIMGYQTYDCVKNPSRVISQGQCIAIGVISSTLWPAVVGVIGYNYLTDEVF